MYGVRYIPGISSLDGYGDARGWCVVAAVAAQTSIGSRESRRSGSRLRGFQETKTRELKSTKKEADQQVVLLERRGDGHSS